MVVPSDSGGPMGPSLRLTYQHRRTDTQVHPYKQVLLVNPVGDEDVGVALRFAVAIRRKHQLPSVLPERRKDVTPVFDSTSRTTGEREFTHAYNDVTESDHTRFPQMAD